MPLVGWAIGLLLGGGAAAVAFRRSERLAALLFRALTVLDCALAAAAALATLAGHPVRPYAWHPSLPGGVWVAGLDPLSAWFLLLIALVGAATAWYGAGYLAGHHGTGSAAPAHALFAVLLAGMMGVVTARAAVLFLVAWELMAVSAYFLIVHEAERADVRRAGLVYLALTHAGTLALFAMFLAWRAPGADFTFGSLAAAGPALPFGGGVVLLLALLGFGIKAGVVPLHFWLPGAHAAAPSHVSALLSGVMLKAGVYGLLRVTMLLGVTPAWWGWTLLGLGAASGVLGVVWALAQRDIKRALAYSSVENVGIVLLGMGVGVLGLSHRQPLVAALGFTAALLHALNHALFKSLLFLGAGAVLRATGTRDLERLGGLARRMPWTAAAFVLGSAAIVGLPPLNGFVSEWVAFQAVLRADGPIRVVVIVAAVLALIAALAVACFARLFAVAFLGRRRAAGDETAVEAAPGLLAPMGALAGCCVGLGLAPVIALEPAARVVAQFVPPLPASPAGATALLAGGLAVSGLARAIIAAIAALAAIRAVVGRRRAARSAPTWGCAFPAAGARGQYTASSFGAPLLAAFGPLARPRIRRTAVSLETDPGDRVLAGLVRPAWARLRGAAGAVRLLQQGRVTTYLQYIVITVLVLLGVLFASGARRP